MAFEHGEYEIRAPDLGVISQIAPWQIPDRAVSDSLNVRFVDGEIHKIRGWLTVDNDPGVCARSIPFSIGIGTQVEQDSWDDDSDSWDNDITQWDDAVFPANRLDGPARWIGVLEKYGRDPENVLATTRGIWRQNPQTGEYERVGDGYTMEFEGRWVGDMFHGVLLLSNGFDEIQIYDGDGAPARRWPGSPRARSLTSFDNKIVVADVINQDGYQPQIVQWTDLNPAFVAEDWNPSPTSQAGYLPILEGPAGRARVERLGNYCAVYTWTAIYLLTAVGFPFIFTRQTAVTGIGIPAQNGVINIHSHHLFLGHDNFYRFTGSEIDAIGNNIRGKFFADLLADKIGEVYGLYDQGRAEAIWVYHSVRGNGRDHDMAIFYNIRNGSWGFRSFPFCAAGEHVARMPLDSSWDSDPSSWDSDRSNWDDGQYRLDRSYLLGGQADRTIAVIEADTSVNCSALPARVDLKLFDFASDTVAAENLKHLNGLRVTCRNRSEDLVVEIGFALDKQSSLAYSQPLRMATTEDRVHFREQSRNFTARLSTDHEDSDFAIREIAFALRPSQGQR